MTKHQASSGDVAGNEKRWIALTSVAAAIVLTGGKLVVGVLTGSLGILSEAAHSALDFVAAALTYLAVRFSDRPADAEHRYGHGKIENLSALVQTLLLLVTCVWIIKEATARLLYKQVDVQATPWAFGVIIVSIIIDVSRSRALMRVAKKYNSQALEADALHFSTDVWSSVVVLIGLALVKYGEITGRASAFERADALAALGVALIVVRVSVQLGRRTVDALLDRVPAGLADAVESSIASVDGVMEVHRLRLRPSGSQTFVDLTISVRRNTPLERSHLIADSVEEKIKAAVPFADVVVHVAPQARDDESIADRVRGVASAMGQAVHSVLAWERDGRIYVELHAEMSDRLELAQAHELADGLEAAIQAAMPEVASVTIHIEPQGDLHEIGEDITATEGEIVLGVVSIAADVPGVIESHDVSVVRAADGLHVAMHCTFDPALSVSEVHHLSSVLEEKVRTGVPGVVRVTTHPEPRRSGA